MSASEFVKFYNVSTARIIQSQSVECIVYVVIQAHTLHTYQKFLEFDSLTVIQFITLCERMLIKLPL